MSVRMNGSTSNLDRVTGLPSASNFTMMGWFFMTVNTAAFQDFLNHSSYTIEVLANNTTLSLWNNSVSVNGSSIIVGKWYHFAMTVSSSSGSNFLGYLNGNLDITATSNGLVASLVSIGNTSLTEILNGRVCGVKIYEAVLTSNEIKNEMKSLRPKRTRSLNAWYPMLTGDTAHVDFSGNGNHLRRAGALSTDQNPNISWK